MSRQKAVRDRKSEMISCWVCAIFVAIVFLGKTLLIGFDTVSIFNIVLLILLLAWVMIAVFYTFQYRKWKKDNM